jgi:hypothetical protein
MHAARCWAARALRPYNVVESPDVENPDHVTIGASDNAYFARQPDPRFLVHQLAFAASAASHLFLLNLREGSWIPA